MFTTESMTQFFRYNDGANDTLLRTAAELTNEQLDQPFDIGLGTLRLTLMHIWAGEDTWLKRWRGLTETPWPNQEEKIPMPDLARRFEQMRTEREIFIATLSDAALKSEITYRDSKGSLFTATLSDMLIQGATHSIHHRAQAANLVRRVSGALVDLDYMYWARKPAQ
jgi:uncharacterized damage-inducible protein DinB